MKSCPLPNSTPASAGTKLQDSPLWRDAYSNSNAHITQVIRRRAEGEAGTNPAALGRRRTANFPHKFRKRDAPRRRSFPSTLRRKLGERIRPSGGGRRTTIVRNRRRVAQRVWLRSGCGPCDGSSVGRLSAAQFSEFEILRVCGRRRSKPSPPTSEASSHSLANRIVKDHFRSSV